LSTGPTSRHISTSPVIGHDGLVCLYDARRRWREDAASSGILSRHFRNAMAVFRPKLKQRCRDWREVQGWSHAISSSNSGGT
jgi:hypothetical protein